MLRRIRPTQLIERNPLEIYEQSQKTQAYSHWVLKPPAPKLLQPCLLSPNIEEIQVEIDSVIL